MPSTSLSPVRPILFCVTGLALFFPAVPAIAQNLLFDNGLPALRGGNFSEVTSAQIGDNFTLNSPSVIHSLQFWGDYFQDAPPAADAFTVAVYDFVGGVPNANPTLSLALGDAVRTDTGAQSGDLELYRYDFSNLNIALAPGQYLLSIQNDTRENPDIAWLWERVTVNDGVAYGRDGSAGGWRQNAFEMAFNLRGTAGGASVAPEPGTLSLFALGVIAGVRLRRLRS